MDSYETFKKQYKNQTMNSPEIELQKVIKNSKKYKQKLIITQAVLGVTVLILLYFFFYIKAQNIQNVAIALSAMIGVLVIRILLELLSMYRFNKLQFQKSVVEFQVASKAYHKLRSRIQLIGTPIVYVIYCAGFVVLLPYFKAGMSRGWYWYTLISGAVVLAVLAIYIGIEIKKEMQLLRFWKQKLTED